jgi:hypothetical protein
VCLLSEIATGDGTCISEEGWSGLAIRQDEAWPNYPRPSTASWIIWRKWISKAFLVRGRRLRQPLGHWIKWDDRWQWYTSPSGDLYSLANGSWFAHRPVMRWNRLLSFSSQKTPCEPPLQPRRATVYFKGTQIVCTGSAAFLSVPTPRPRTFTEHLTQVISLRWCLDSLTVINEGKELLEALKTGMSASVMAVSDGPFKDTYGTAAWTIGTEENGAIITGKAICPGGQEDHSAYRSELTGLYSIMVVTHQLCLFYGVEEGQVEVGCDGSSALQTAFGRDPVLTSDIPDFDIVGAIYCL